MSGQGKTFRRLSARGARLMLAVLPAAAILTGGCAKKPARTEPPPVNVTVSVIRPIEILEDTFELHAKVAPNRVVHVAAEVAGRVEQICCTEGRQVGNRRKDKPLLKLKTDLLQAAFDSAKAQADVDETERERTKRLHARGAAGDSELDTAAGRAAVSKAALDEARGRLERATIYPPIAGVLNRLRVELGEYVQPGQVVAEIVDADTVKVVADVPERDVHFIALGGEVTVLYTFQRRPMRRAAKVTYVGRLAHERSLTTRVEIAMDNRDGRLFSGQIVRVRMVRRRLRNVIMISIDAILPQRAGEGGSATRYVAYVVEGGKARRRDRIELDRSVVRGKRIRVVAGLRAGERLIVRGQRYVGPGQDVRVIEPKGAPRPATRRAAGDTD